MSVSCRERKLSPLVLCVVLSVCGLPSVSSGRDWNLVNGRKIRGDFAGCRSTVVRVRGRSGMQYLAFHRLRDADQIFVRQQLALARNEEALKELDQPERLERDWVDSSGTAQMYARLLEFVPRSDRVRVERDSEVFEYSYHQFSKRDQHHLRAEAKLAGYLPQFDIQIAASESQRRTPPDPRFPGRKERKPPPPPGAGMAIGSGAGRADIDGDKVDLRDLNILLDRDLSNARNFVRTEPEAPEERAATRPPETAAAAADPAAEPPRPRKRDLPERPFGSPDPDLDETTLQPGETLATAEPPQDEPQEAAAADPPVSTTDWFWPGVLTFVVVTVLLFGIATVKP